MTGAVDTRKRSKRCLPRFLAVIVLASALMLLVTIACPAWPAGGEKKGDDTGRLNRKVQEISQREATRSDIGSTWYLAEGTTAHDFETTIAIVNPNAEDVLVDITYMTGSGPIYVPDVYLAARSQTSINPEETIGQMDFSTKVQSTGGEDIAVDRVMIWPGAESVGMHCSIGVTQPETKWYLAEGSTGGDFETWILVQNPGTTTANVQVNYNTLSGFVPGPSKVVGPGSRWTVHVADVVPGNWSVSTEVTSSRAIIAERAMYWKGRSGGHDSIGTEAPSDAWFLAEGSTGGDFETWILVQNPTNSTANVIIDFLTDQGLETGPRLSLGPRSRKTVEVARYVPFTWEVSTFVIADQPVIAERAMYGNNRQWGHDSIGMDTAHDVFLFPSGGDYVEGNISAETWTLVQNPNGEPVDIFVGYYTPPEAETNYNFRDTIPAYSRATYSMGDTIGDEGYASTLVVCETPGCKVMVESAIYAKYDGQRIAGAASIGGYADVE